MSKVEEKPAPLGELSPESSKIITDALLSMNRDDIISLLKPMAEALRDSELEFSQRFSACMNDFREQMQPLCNALIVIDTPLTSSLKTLAGEVVQRSEELKVNTSNVSNHDLIGMLCSFILSENMLHKSEPFDEDFRIVLASFINNGMQTQRVNDTELKSSLTPLAEQIAQRSEELKTHAYKTLDDDFIEIAASFFNRMETLRVTDTTMLDELAVHEEVNIISDDELARELALANLVD
jgi:hypothetical protein